MNEFLKFFDEHAKSFPMHLAIHYSKFTDWCIAIFKIQCADMYPNATTTPEGDVVIVRVQDVDIELCFAKAYVQLKEWLLKYNGGY